MSIHFEELWELCEKLNQESLNNNSIQSIIDNLIIKINLYKIVDQKTEINEDEIKTIKSRLYGEILLSLTSLSLHDNINVFDALMTAYKCHSVNFYSDKYSTD